MRVPPNGSRPIHRTESTAPGSGAAVSKKQFEAPVSQGKTAQSVQSTRAADILADVQALALEVKSGSLSKEEATKRFASIVIEKRHDLKELGPKAEQVKEAIQNIVGDDPSFVARLNTQLQQLAKA